MSTRADTTPRLAKRHKPEIAAAGAAAAAAALAGKAGIDRIRGGDSDGDGSSQSRAYRLEGEEKPAAGIRRIALGRAEHAKDLGADLVFAWPQAEIGIMAANQAVEIVHRRELADGNGATPPSLTDAYIQDHLSAEVAAANGFVDEVIDPSQTRSRLAWAFASLEGGR